jgi:oligoendopeptidase F
MDWNLDTLFPQFNGPEMRGFKEALRTDLASAAEAAAAPEPLNAARLADLLLRLESAQARLSHLSSYIECLCAADAAHEGYMAEEGALSELWSEFSKAEASLLQLLNRLDERELAALNTRPEAAGAELAIHWMRIDAQRRMSLPEEKLAAELGVTGLQAWGRLYDSLAGNLEFPMPQPDGTVTMVPMAQRRSLLSHPDRTVRQAAFDGGNQAWVRVEATTAFALNSIAGTRLILNRRRGIEHFLDPALRQQGIERATLEALLEGIRRRSDLPRAALRMKAQRLGIPAAAWWDIEAGTPLPGGPLELPWQAACSLISGAFGRVYPQLGSFFDEMLEQRQIDWSPRRSKRPGGFCTTSRLTSESRIFMTYNGALADAVTLAHEAGHAWHSRLLRGQRPLAQDYPMTLAETASTFAELVFAEGVMNDPAVEPGLRLRLLEAQARGAIAFLLDIPSRYEFERRFHEERSNGEVSVSRLKQLMVESQREIFGDALAEGGEDPLFWASKLHFYATGTTFYNYPYAFGFLLSRACYQRFKSEGQPALESFELLLRESGRRKPEDLIEAALGEDPRRPEFWEKAIATLEEPLSALRRELS